MQKSSEIPIFGAKPAKGLSPIIGLAVVVALAMAAVFGAMSLANPAMAAIGQPADAGLAERTFSPQDATTTVAVGETKVVDITSYITGGRDVVTLTGTSASADDTDVIAAGDANVYLTSTIVELAVRGSAVGLARVTATIAMENGDPAQTVIVDVTVTAAGASTAPTLRGQIGSLTVSSTATTTDPKTTNIARYFTKGSGPNGEIASYNVVTLPASGGDVTVTVSDDGVLSYFPTGATGTSIRVTLKAVNKAGTESEDAHVFYINVVSPSDETSAADPDFPSFKGDSNNPGKNTRYTVMFEFKANDEGVDTVNTLIHDLVIELPDYGVPSAISTSDVTITTGKYRVDDTGNPMAGACPVPSGEDGECVDYTFNPRDVSVDGEEIFISIGDITEDDDIGIYTVGGDGVTMEVVFRQSAGISNPTAAGTYFAKAITFGDVVGEEYDEDAEMPAALEQAIPRLVSLDSEDGGLGTVVTATGKGFRKATSLIVFIDKPSHQDDDDNPDTMADNDDDDPNSTDTMVRGTLDLGEDVLCTAAVISGSSIGSCEFIVTHPTFDGGINYINAVDGRNGYINKPTGVDDEKPLAEREMDDLIDGDPDNEMTYDLAEFDLTASVKATPEGGSPGEIMQVQVVDFPRGAIRVVEIGRQPYCGGLSPDGTNDTCAGVVDAQGSANFQIEIPNWVKGGIQELRVTGQKENATDDDYVKASTNVTLVGPQINVTPGTVVANQRISLVGTGFSPSSVIANADDDKGLDDPVVTIGGDVIDDDRINDGDAVRVDNGGNWSASVDLPLSEATTAEGDRTIRITDTRGRTGTVDVVVAPRVVTVTPERGRVGTIAVVRGTGFPSKNDEGSSFSVEIVYDASNNNTTTVSALPDASGRFETQLRIPTTAAIPSSNSIKVSFEAEGIDVVTTVSHEVPEGIITLSETSGGPGSTVSISGEGFKSFVPISLVKVGTLDVTPAPKPATDGNGMMSFDVTIPGLDVGIQTIEVNVGQTTASTGFTVTESGINPGDIKPVAEGLEGLGENLDVIWHFNNDTKDWTFYDGEEGSTLTHVITGETYLILIKSTTEVILNRDTRNLTCGANGNCWNQIVW